jgi:hypothetical protein
VGASAYISPSMCTYYVVVPTSLQVYITVFWVVTWSILVDVNITDEPEVSKLPTKHYHLSSITSQTCMVYEEY